MIENAFSRGEFEPATVDIYRFSCSHFYSTGCGVRPAFGDEFFIDYFLFECYIAYSKWI